VLLPAGGPPILQRLLGKELGAETRDEWAEFIAAHSAILLHTCRRMARDRDDAMDAYAYVLDALSQNGYRRLRAYRPSEKTQFTTWLVVVTRRLLLDRHRHRYGRPRSEEQSRRDEHETRRQLEQLVGAEIEPDELSSGVGNSPDLAIRRAQLADALQRAIDELDPADRLVLALRFEDERSVREIATLLKVPTIFHAYRRIAGALAALKGALAHRGVDGPEP
jgi:RNA polymerase sigma factor (sigma-70 family)